MIAAPAATESPGPGCPRCGSSVAAARNPFYGVDLAVHQYVRNCVDCFWYDFASDSARRTAVPPARRRLHGLWTAAISVFKVA
ncbi:MAG: hypothetical protein WED09_00945 [Homoserinimonas sp.]